MNVIVSNKQKAVIDNANIDAIKDLYGLFNVNDLINKFKNYFFSKMILDATSVIDFASQEVLKKLADEIGPDRLIILLPSTPEPPLEFKKELIDLKIYNFSNNIDDVVSFIEKPNTYENATNALMNSTNGNSEYYVDSSIKDGEVEDEEEPIEQENEDLNVDDEEESDNSNQTSPSLGDIMSRFNVYHGEKENDDESEENEEENSDEQGDDYGITTSDIKLETIKESDVSKDDNKSSDTDVDTKQDGTFRFLNMDGFDEVIDYSKPKEKKVIGFKNITSHAGSTTLIYMLHRLAKRENKDVLSIEINKNDFKLFRNSKMISVDEESVANTLDSIREDIVFVDLNDCKDDSFCNEIIYLVEPSTIKLNDLMMKDKTIFNTLKDKKVILNQSMLSRDDIPVLEKEAGIEFFLNIESINDRTDNSVIKELFDKLKLSDIT